MENKFRMKNGRISLGATMLSIGIVIIMSMPAMAEENHGLNGAPPSQGSLISDYEIRGFIQDEVTNAVVSGAEVSVIHPVSEEILQDFTDANGYYEINLGDFEETSCYEYDYILVKIYEDDYEENAMDQICIGEDEGATTVNMKLRPKIMNPAKQIDAGSMTITNRWVNDPNSWYWNYDDNVNFVLNFGQEVRITESVGWTDNGEGLISGDQYLIDLTCILMISYINLPYTYFKTDTKVFQWTATPNTDDSDGKLCVVTLSYAEAIAEKIRVTAYFYIQATDLNYEDEPNVIYAANSYWWTDIGFY